RAPAIRGSYSVEQAAQLALGDSGLRLARTPQGTLTVLASVAAPAASPATAAPGRAQDHALAEVKVVAQADRAGTTEGTGS
ncbi:STN domain-containing protein, partial [Escherichia coli]|uniref:STN domain-containing protein n=2 Tax=Pseudomonadota TaxID=1224 RepID=UPI0039E1DD14